MLMKTHAFQIGLVCPLLILCARGLSGAPTKADKSAIAVAPLPEPSWLGNKTLTAHFHLEITNGEAIETLKQAENCENASVF